MHVKALFSVFPRVSVCVFYLLSLSALIIYLVYGGGGALCAAHK